MRPQARARTKAVAPRTSPVPVIPGKQGIAFASLLQAEIGKSNLAVAK
jgi:hypothetical protein